MTDETAASLLDRMVSGQWLDAQQFPPLEWSVEGVIPEGFGLLVAPPKAGKSWMVAGIGLACAAGGYAFGKIPLKQRPVLYLALEDGHRRLQDRFRTLMEGEPIPGIDLIVSARTYEIVGIIAEYLALHSGEAPLIILDTLGKVKPPKRPGDESYQADYAIGSQLKGLIDGERGATLLCVHHTRKAESADFVDAVSGTQGIAGSADFVLVLSRKRHEDSAILAVTGRDVVEGEYALTTSGGRWVLDGDTLADAAATARTRRESSDLGDRSAEALTFVNSRPIGTRPKDLASHLDIDANVAGNYLRRLHDSGRIAKRTRGVYIPVEVVEVVENEETAGLYDLDEHGENTTSTTSTTEPDGQP